MSSPMKCGHASAPFLCEMQPIDALLASVSANPSRPTQCCMVVQGCFQIILVTSHRESMKLSTATCGRHWGGAWRGTKLACQMVLYKRSLRQTSSKQVVAVSGASLPPGYFALAKFGRRAFGFHVGRGCLRTTPGRGRAWYQTGVSDGPLKEVVAPNEFKAGGCSQSRLPAVRLLRVCQVRPPSVPNSHRQRVPGPLAAFEAAMRGPHKPR